MKITSTSTCLRYLVHFDFYHYTSQIVPVSTFCICFQLPLFFLLPLVLGSPFVSICLNFPHVFTEQLQFLCHKHFIWSWTLQTGKDTQCVMFTWLAEGSLLFSKGKYLGQPSSSISSPYFQGFNIESFMCKTEDRTILNVLLPEVL